MAQRTFKIVLIKPSHYDRNGYVIQWWMTYAGYILGFPTDTPESIARDIEIIKKESPIDILEFFCLTPLPGSEDHKSLLAKGVPMNSDMNIYDLEHVCTTHPRIVSGRVGAGLP